MEGTAIPRDSVGTYSLPQGYLAATGDTILPSQHNPPLEDIAVALTGSLPRNGSAPMMANLPMGGRRITNMANGEVDTDGATLGQISKASPIGVTVPFAGPTAPDGWLLCYGQAVSRTTYAALFSVIGTAWGAGNGSTTFNVPDLRDVTIAGKANMGGTDRGLLSAVYGSVARTLGGFLGTASHVLTIAQMPSHSHSGNTDFVEDHDHELPNQFSANTSGTGGFIGPAPYSSNGTRSSSPNGRHRHGFATNSTGSGQAHPNAQPTAIMNMIIRAL